jgi:hypothetical protein
MRRFRSVRRMLEALAVLLLVAVTVVVVAGPLRKGAVPEDAGAPEREALEEAKAAKYAEIREAELDRRTGKLAEDDWRVVDGQLRAEAVAILREIDSLR